MQQPGPMFRDMPSLPLNITTEQVQMCLDENKNLILAILDTQNAGNFVECAQYQAKLQKNLMYLAALADAQPQGTPLTPQMIPHPMMPQQPGGYFMQHPQVPAAMATQQAGLYPQSQISFNNPMQNARQQQYMVRQPNRQMPQGPIAGGPNGMYFPQNESVSGVSSCSVPISTKEEKPDVTSAPFAGGNPHDSDSE